MTHTPVTPDSLLNRNVVDELKWTPGLNPARIGVVTADGAVTLTGTVESYPERLLAQQAAARVKGVRAITEEMTVRGGSAGADTDIARDACQALARAVDLGRDTVTASVRDHVITLRGTVPWHFQRESAMRSVRHLRGVRDVHDHIDVKAPAPAGNIRKSIEAALERHAVVDAATCAVTVEGSGAVCLEGTVGTWVERDQVERMAWAAPGVTAVRNDLSVADPTDPTD